MEPKLTYIPLTKKQEIDSYLSNFEDGNGDINFVAWNLVEPIEELYGDANDWQLLEDVEMALEILKSAKRRKFFKWSVNEKTAQYIKTLKEYKKKLSA